MYLDRNEPLPQRKVLLGEGVANIAYIGIQRRKFFNPYEGEVLTPYKLVTFLHSLHVQRNLCLRNDKLCYLKAARNILKKYSQTTCIEAMFRAAELARHPWSFSFVDKIAVELGKDTTVSPLLNIIGQVIND